MRNSLYLNWPRLILVGLVVLLISLYASLPNSLHENLERAAYDQMLVWVPVADSDERVILVDIDEKSLRDFGAWPWPRKQVAALISQLTQHYNVSLLGVDIVFPEAKDDDALLKKSAQST